MVTGVPPPASPPLGVTEETAGGARYVKPPSKVLFCPSGFATCTSAGPAACGGVVAVIWLELPTLTPPAGTPPIRTLAPDWKFEPEIVTTVPPVIGPDVGATLEIAADPVYVNPAVR